MAWLSCRPGGRRSRGSAAAPAEKPRGGKKAAAKEVSFRYVLDHLHERMAPEKLKEISFAYCFICLLTLAAKEGLEVVGDGDMSEMLVRFPAA